MNTISLPSKIFPESGLPAVYLWKNMAIEKKSSAGWLQKFYRKSLVRDFWMVLTSRVG